MSEPIDFAQRMRDQDGAVEAPERESRPDIGTPSNAVYLRVGDSVLLTAREGVRRGLTPQDILLEIREKHQTHMNVGDLRLLLATRRVREKTS